MSYRAVGTVAWVVACAATAGCGDRPTPDTNETRPSAPTVLPSSDADADAAVVVADAFVNCDGDERDHASTWERRGDWLVNGDRRVPAGVADRLRELARSAPDAATAPLPPELGITPGAVESHADDIYDAAVAWEPQIARLEAPVPAVTFELVARAARERLVDPDEDTDHTTFSVTLPGAPPVVLVSHSESPFMQPWHVAIGSSPSRAVLSLEISRYAALLTDPASDVAVELDGTRYWRRGFWHDEDIWSDVFGDPWTAQRAREMCSEIEGWESVARTWELERADLGYWSPGGDALHATLSCRTDHVVNRALWHDPMDSDGDPELGWDVFLDVHDRAEAAASRFACLQRWREAGPGRAVELESLGEAGHAEPTPEFFHAPVWAHSELAGDPEFEFRLWIEDECVATILLGGDSDGAIVIYGHESLTGDFQGDFHPTTGGYAILRRDGAVDERRMPRIDPDDY